MSLTLFLAHPALAGMSYCHRKDVCVSVCVCVCPQFARIATPQSILDGFGFCLFCWIDQDPGHRTWSFFSQISNFKKLNFKYLMKILKTLLLPQFSMDFGSVCFVGYIKIQDTELGRFFLEFQILKS